MHETYAVFAAGGAVLCLLTALLVWRRRQEAPAAALLVGTQTATAVWCGVDAVAAFWPHTPPIAVFLVLIPAVHALSAGALCFNFRVTDPQWRLRRRMGLLLLVAPVLSVAAVATNGLHHLFFRTVTDGGLAPVIQFGPLFWAHTAYCYTVVGLALTRLVRAWRRAPGVFRRQYGTMLVADLAPTVALVVGGLSGHAAKGTDLTPFGFTLTGLLVTYALFGQGMLKLVPVARARVVDSLPDGIFVIDPAGTLVDVNLAGRALLADVRPDLPAEMVGRPAGELLRSPDLSEYLLGRQETGSEAIVRELRPGLHIAFQVITHYDERGRILAKVITTRDISAMVTAERELREHMATIDALRETLQEEAIRDALTGLHNRRHADAVLETAVTAQEPFVVLLLDVDHFKAVNDRYGHHGGDQVLRAISRVLGLSVRTGDVVARWGGEEFLVLLPGASLEGAIARAEQIRSACAQATQGPAGEGARRLPAVTVSVGVASFPACGSSGEKIVAAADAALYAAKAAGRNRVLTAPGAAPAAPATAAFLNA